VPGGKTTLEALHYLAALGPSRKQTLDKPPLDIIATPWKRLVFDEEHRVSRRGYTLCFLDQLQDALRRRDVYVGVVSENGKNRTLSRLQRP